MTHLNDTLTDREVDYWSAQLDTQFPRPVPVVNPAFRGVVYGLAVGVLFWAGVVEVAQATVACLNGWWIWT